jgi:signal transduction histidine kinase
MRVSVARLAGATGLRHWILGLWLIALLAPVAAWAAHPRQLTQVQALVMPDGKPAFAESLQLPYHWDRRNPGQRGFAEFEIPFEMYDPLDRPLAVYVPRLGNAYEIWFNGTLLQKNGDMAEFNGADFAKVPRYLVVPASLLQQRNLFLIKVRADVGRRGGLSPLFVGPEAKVHPRYLGDYRLRSTGTLVVVVVSLLVGLVALSIWATQRYPTFPGGGGGRDALYLNAGLAEICWTVSAANAIWDHPPVDWPWWGVLTAGALAAWVGSMTLVCMDVGHWRDRAWARWLHRWVVLEVVATMVAAWWALEAGMPLALTVSYAVMGMTALIFSLAFVIAAFRSASFPQRAVAVALVLNTLVGLRDIYAFRFSQDLAGTTYLRYSSVLFGLVLGYIVVTRFRAVAAQAQELMATLAGRVAQKESELAQSYQKLEQLASERARAQERARVLRDMHDGVGAHISSAIRQLESGRSSQAEVLQTLRDSLDQLKLSIDAMNLPQGDITALLANLRYRLEPRFAASDIELQWDVDVMEPVARLDSQGMRHLQFMLFEALSNVLQHAAATVLRIEASATDGGAVLRIVDNGRGFDVTAPPRKGLASQRERASAMGASVQIASQPGRTVVEIRIG